jgi:hypothetical protein
MTRALVVSTPTVTWDVWEERATGIEPAFSAWEADVLPLNYARERPPHYPLTPLVKSQVALALRFLVTSP